ncbi:MAG: hypothetical protein ACT4NV_15000 [Rhodoferax sp.]
MRTTSPPMPRFRPDARQTLIAKVQTALQTQSWPRLQMLLIVSLTGLAGLLCSALLLRLGMLSMAWRYPLAVLGAYGVFLCLLWLWLRTYAPPQDDTPATPQSSSSNAGDWVDAAELGTDVASAVPRMRGLDIPVSARTTTDSNGWSPPDLGDADELAVVLVAIAAVVGMALAAFYLVWSAPALLAEVLLDGALATTLYRRVRGLERQHWLSSALRHTRWALAGTVLLLALCGAALEHWAPGAHTLGQALAQTRESP